MSFSAIKMEKIDKMVEIRNSATIIRESFVDLTRNILARP